MNPTFSSLLSFPFIFRLLGVFRLGLLTCLSLVSFLLVTPLANAQQTDTWTGGGANDLVLNSANWDTGQPPQTGDSLIFAGVIRLTPTLNSALSIASLSFASGAGAFVLGGPGTYTITTATGVANNSTNTETINNAITLGIAQTWYATSGNLVFGGNVNTAGFQLTINGGNVTSITGVVSGTGRLTKTSTGTLTLSGANTYSGGTTLSAGNLNINNAKALGTGTFTISGGTIDNTTAGAITLSFNNVQAWNGNFTFTGTQSLNLGTGAVTLGASRTVTVNANNLTVGGIISGSGFGLTKAGNGTLTLSGANTYTGGTTFGTGTPAGTLNINNASALGTGTFTIASGSNAVIDNTTGGAITLSTNNAQAWNSNFTFTGTQSLNLGTGAVTLGASRTVTVNANNLTVGGVISGSGFGLTKAGNGTLTLTGANTYTGNTTVNGGTLTLAGTSGRALGSTSSITVNSGGTLLLGASDQINTTAPMTLAGGTFAKGNFSEGSTTTAGVGALTLTASGSHLDFGTGTVGALSFSSFAPGLNTLLIDNWTGTPNMVGNASTDRLIFNSDQTLNLANFSFAGYQPGAVEFTLGGGFFEVTPLAAVPEPATYVTGFLTLAALGYNQRRRWGCLLRRHVTSHL